MFWRLVSVKLLMGINVLRRGSAANRLRSQLTALLFGIVFVVVYMAARGGFDTISSALSHPYGARLATEKLFATIPPGFFFACFGMLVTSAVTVGLQVLYLAPELNLLVACPISARTIFAAKFLEALGANSALFLALGLPILLAYGTSLAALSIGYLLFLLVAFLGFSAIATSLGLIICILVARVVSPARASRTLLVTGGLVLFLLFMVSAGMMTSVRGVAEQGGDLTASLQGRWVAYRQALRIPPWSWAGESVTFLVLYDDFAGALHRLLMLLGAGALSVAVVSGLAGRIWYSGWASGQESGSAARRRRVAASPPWEEWVLFLLPTPIRGVVLKETRTFIRDVRRLSLLVMPLAAVAMVAVSVRVEGSVAFATLSHGLPLFMTFLLAASLSYRVALATFASENKAFWIVQSSSSGMVGVLIGKTIFAAALSFLVSMASLAIFYPISQIAPPALGTSVLLLIPCAAALGGLGVGLSALFVDFNRETTREAVSIGGRLVCIMANIAYLGFAMAFGGLVYAAGKAMGFSQPVVMGAVLVCIALLSALSAIVPILIGASRLSRMEWS